MSRAAQIQYELFSGWSKQEAAMLLAFFAVQTAVFVCSPESFTETLAAFSGILCVVFAGKGKISNFCFGLITVLLYAYVSFSYGLYGEMMLNLLVYAPIQFIGFILWRKHMSGGKRINADNAGEVIARILGGRQMAMLAAILFIATFAYIQMLYELGSELPALDGATVMISIVAQILMVLRFREQWILWIIVNLMSIALWLGLWFKNGCTSWPMVSMYGIYLINAVYSYFNWTRLAKQHAFN